MARRLTEDTANRFKAQEKFQNGEPVEVPTDTTPDVTQEQPDMFNVGKFTVADTEEPIQNAEGAIGKDQVKDAYQTLQKYKSGKSHYEANIVQNEQWWKLRHWGTTSHDAAYDEPKPASAWLFNCVMSKHADFMDSIPEPVILPREQGDDEEAQRLTSILPVVMEQNDFEAVYSDETLYKIKQGTGCYGVFWDNSKLNGLGDIAIKSIDLLSLFWEPGVTDIQKSQNVFYVELVDNKVLEDKYPQCKGQLKTGGADQVLKKYVLDDTVDTSNKSFVIDWYYKKPNSSGKVVLHYCKFVDDIVLYATENDTEQPMKSEMQPMVDKFGMPIMDNEGLPMLQPILVPDGEPISEKGWYDHGLYPFVLDVLFKMESTPLGFGYIDVCKNSQMSIDVYNNAIEKNLQFNAYPRYFARQDSSINEDELLDPHKTVVHVDGNLGQDALRPIDKTGLDGIYVTILNNKIDELKETAGNRDVNNGGTTAGVTAASAVAALQESAGKTSRSQIKGTWRAYQKVISLCIELIRQFYDMPRQFRIMGERGRQEFITYDNSNLKGDNQGNAFGVDMGFRLPVFDIKVSAQKENKYSQLSQNELALQFYNSGFFNPQFTDQVLACLDMMQFQGKEDVQQKIEQNGGMYQQMLMMQQQMLQMAQIIDAQNGTQMADAQAGAILNNANIPVGQANVDMNSGSGENAIVSKSRERAAQAAQPR